MFLQIRSAFADLIAPELKNERRSLERLANMDELTGVANRRAFDLARRTAELDDLTAFVFFDANNFGKLNKLAGHKFGDQVLIEMAGCIRRAADRFEYGVRVFRIGGDEFVVLCSPGVAYAIRDAAEAGFGVRFPNIRVSVSGTVGATLEDAERDLQSRKAARKAEQ